MESKGEGRKCRWRGRKQKRKQNEAARQRGKKVAPLWVLLSKFRHASWLSSGGDALCSRLHQQSVRRTDSRNGLDEVLTVVSAVSLVVPEAHVQFQHILRLLNTNVDGKVSPHPGRGEHGPGNSSPFFLLETQRKIMFALTEIKGVGRRYANVVCKKADVDLNKRYGYAPTSPSPTSSTQTRLAGRGLGPVDVDGEERARMGGEDAAGQAFRPWCGWGPRSGGTRSACGCGVGTTVC